MPAFQKSEYTRTRRKMSAMTLKASEYQELKECFQGGFTHANAHRVGKLLTKVSSFDFTSSYPAVMVAEKFPMSSGKYLGSVSREYILENIDRKAFMFRVKLYKLEPKLDCEHPISLSKCRGELYEDPVTGELKKKFPLLDNGRIFRAYQIETTITEQDLLTYLDFYTWDKETEEFYDCWEYEKAYLPTPFVEAILKLYKDKTELKGIDGREIDYQVAKGMLNSAYGMTVTDIVREQLFYDEDRVEPFFSNYDTFKLNHTPEEEEALYQAYLLHQIDRYNTNPYRFLFYPWGVWVTAYARRNLFTGIKECDKDYVYSDTDSIKLLHLDKHRQYFEDYNRKIIEKLEQACDWHQIPVETIKPKNAKGVEKPLGVWEYEGEYTEFKTLGAKRYMWHTIKDEKEGWNLTVAGVKKTSGMQYLLDTAEAVNKNRTPKNKISPFDLFNLDLVVPANYSGRNVLTYIDHEIEGEVEDYCGVTLPFKELSCIHMEGTEYSLNPMSAFLNYLFGIKEDSW